ncbi:MAG: hypothetical protein ABH868_00045 [bacterium]
MKKFSLLILTVVFMISSVTAALAVDVTWGGYMQYHIVRFTPYSENQAIWRIADYRDKHEWKDAWFMWNAGTKVPDVWSDSWQVPMWRASHADGITRDTWIDWKMNCAFSDNTSIMFKFFAENTHDRSWYEGPAGGGMGGAGEGGENRGYDSSKATRIGIQNMTVKTFVDPYDIQIGGLYEYAGGFGPYGTPVIGKFEYLGVKVGVPIGDYSAAFAIGTNDNRWLSEANTGGASAIGTASISGDMGGAKVGATLLSAAPNYRTAQLVPGPRTVRFGVDASKTIAGIGFNGVLAYVNQGSGVVDRSWDSWMQGYNQIVLALDAKYAVPNTPLTIDVFMEPTQRTTRDDRPPSGGGGPAANETWREAYRPGETYMKLLAGLDLEYKISEKATAGIRYDWGDSDLSVGKGDQIVTNKPKGEAAAGYKAALATDNVFTKITGRVGFNLDGVNVIAQLSRENFPKDLHTYYGVLEKDIKKTQDELRIKVETSF